MARQVRNVPAFAYLRTSSAANVGADKDSDKNVKPPNLFCRHEFHLSFQSGGSHSDHQTPLFDLAWPPPLP